MVRSSTLLDDSRCTVFVVRLEQSRELVEREREILRSRDYLTLDIQDPRSEIERLNKIRDPSETIKQSSCQEKPARGV